MEYVMLEEIKISDYDTKDLPFLKRAGFRAEEEFRIIYTGPCKGDAHFMKINLEWINRIVLNPWLPASLVDAIAETFKEISGNPDLKVTASRLTNSQTWTRWGKQIVKRG
jgi:hypothetical protein